MRPRFNDYFSPMCVITEAISGHEVDNHFPPSCSFLRGRLESILAIFLARISESMCTPAYLSLCNSLHQTVSPHNSADIFDIVLANTKIVISSFKSWSRDVQIRRGKVKFSFSSEIT